ncbi:hypothetical protein ACFV1N_38145 [Streptosporangium canum]|uniref:hypothetical protein n=1 Tax=Streptosporangium canum TaxID=324952 RepID=UPI0036A5FA9B
MWPAPPRWHATLEGRAKALQQAQDPAAATSAAPATAQESTRRLLAERASE